MKPTMLLTPVSKYADRYLTKIQYRSNRRFDLGIIKRFVSPSILSVGEVIKTRKFTSESQLDLAYRAITLLTDDNFRLTFIR